MQHAIGVKCEYIWGNNGLFTFDTDPRTHCCLPVAMSINILQLPKNISCVCKTWSWSNVVKGELI